MNGSRAPLDRAGRIEPDPEEQALYDELRCWTLALGDPTFVHQHVVDAWAAQHATERTKPIALTFGLVGLHLHLERGFTGRQVQRAHMALARKKHVWPSYPLPRERGALGAREVMQAPAGRERVAAIDAWCASVWEVYRESRRAVAELLARHAIVSEDGSARGGGAGEARP